MTKVNELLGKYNINLDEVEAHNKQKDKKELLRELVMLEYIRPNYIEGFEYILIGTSRFFFVVCTKITPPGIFAMLLDNLPTYGIISKDELNIKTYINTMEIIYNATVAEFEKINDTSKLTNEEISKRFKFFCIGIAHTLVGRLVKEHYKDDEGNDITNTLSVLVNKEYSSIVDELKAQGSIEETDGSDEAHPKDGEDVINYLKGMRSGDNIPIKDSKRLD